jgi:signal transduction histidine kinase
MRKIGRLLGVFSFRRVSGQIAALILVSLFLIHALIAGYFILNRSPPQQMIDEPIHHFELLSRVVDLASDSERGVVLTSINRSFPDLRLSIVNSESAALTWPTEKPMKMPSSFGDRLTILPATSPDKNIARFRLTDGNYLDAQVARPRLPAFLTALWASTLLFLLFSITLLGAWAGRALTSPLTAFTKAAETFSLSGASTPLPEQGPEEIKSVAKALNVMRDRITALVSDRTRMLTAISHDLRTPITRLRLRAEYIEDGAQREQIVRDLDQMQSMLEAVIVLLRGGTGAAPRLVDAAALVRTICSEFADGGHAVSYVGPDRLNLMMRADEIYRAVSNLIDNATRYGSSVTVELRAHEGSVDIVVSDDGPGIPEDKRRAMLEPFVRGEEARTMDQESGFGLGLSIAHSIAGGHDGGLQLQSNSPSGLQVILSLPRRSEDLLPSG